VSSLKDIPFIGRAGGSGGRTNSGFESIGDETPPKPNPKAPLSIEQKVRATDLFLRGALTPEQLAKAKASRAGFEVIIGKSNFLPAVFLDTGAATSRATCQIRTSGVNFRGQAGEWTGTGFLVSPNVVLTNHHVLNSPAVASAGTCVFNYQLGGDGRPMEARAFRLRPDRLFVTSPADGGLDYTFCWVDGDPGRDFGAVRITRRAFDIAEQEFANVISHPDGRMKEIAIHENEVQWQDELVVHYTSDTEPGSSGAAVCNNNWQLIALHHASKKSKVRGYELLNEGVKLSAVAADLERRARAGGRSGDQAGELLALFGGNDEQLGFFGSLGRETPAAGLEALVELYKGTDQDLDVGFWNVEWLTKWYETKTPAVAKVIRQMNLDVWTLEESSPNAAKAVVAELRETYGLAFDWLGAEPDAADGKQSCTVLWNTATVECVAETWGEPIETWLKVHSKDAEDLGFEAVHGKVFDRYPALFRVKAKRPAGEPSFEFYLVPLHLKAMDEGSLRRQMASKILAAAVKKKIELGGLTDFVIGGDYNAELATEDFAALAEGGMVPLSAEDEQGGAFSYIKGPKSLIDHIFLSPNLAERYGAKDYFIVAVDKTFPNYVNEVSDHRPVLVRLSLKGAAPGGGGFESMDAGTTGAMAELEKLLVPARRRPIPTADGFERRAGRRADASVYDDRTGYDPGFLGRGDHRVPLPGLSAAQSALAAVVNEGAAGLDRFVLPYTHFSVVMHGDRQMAFYSAVNIDGTQLRRIPRSATRWRFDPRIQNEMQTGDDVYRNNDLDRGHLTRRLDPVWGEPDEAALADEDTFHFTNACPQHKDLNQREWSDLEDYVLDNAGAHDLRISVFTGPVFRSGDQEYRGVQLPKEFWKVVVMVRGDTRQLSATGYVLSQADMITGFEFVFGEFRTYQVTIRKIAEMTGLDFGRLVGFDPMARARPGPEGGFESAAAGAKLVTGPESLVL
jgi:DNA/RNA endonuclease G (NUC1)/V8-like Glu-specific endopeptidase/endonuclease/exonuclease/phosphatase family metal-dependent hydrolase